MSRALPLLALALCLCGGAVSCRRGGRWVAAHEERFEGTDLGAPAWSVDPVPDDGPFSDGGAYFAQKGIRPPRAFRISQSFGQAGWLTVEAYSRSSATPYASLVSVVDDPAAPPARNRVLRLRSPRHTDAVLIRCSRPLPERYRVSLRVGFASFGDGKPGRNGYAGPARAEPWLDEDATAENGFYWLAVLDALPRPHNNLWIHHHRKLVIDSDNNVPPWTEIWDGRSSSFVRSGERPVMLFALDGRARADDRTGPPFLAWAAGSWQPSGKIRAVDRYLSRTWYRVSLTREGDRFAVELEGDFELGGRRRYQASLDAAAAGVFRHERAWPDYFMLGDPHNNYYEGEVYFDDLRLEIWRP